MARIEKLSLDSSEQAILTEIIEQYHPDLVAAGVRVRMEFAIISEKAAEKGDYALKELKYPVAAKIKITNMNVRRYGNRDECPDAVVVVDKESWDAMNEDECRAELDRQVCRIEIVKSKDGDIKLDDCLRPKLALRPYDKQYGWFRQTAGRHGSASGEVIEAKDLIEDPQSRNTFFPFLSSVAFTNEPVPSETSE